MDSQHDHPDLSQVASPLGTKHKRSNDSRNCRNIMATNVKSNLTSVSQKTVTEQKSAFPVEVLGKLLKLVREAKYILYFSDQFTRFLQLSNVPMSVSASLLALHLHLGCTTINFSHFPTVNYHLFSNKNSLQNV